MNDDCLYFQGHLYNLKDARVREISFTARWINVKYRYMLGHVCLYKCAYKNGNRNLIKRQLKLCLMQGQQHICMQEKMMISVKVHQGRKVYLMHMPLENSK